MKYIDILDEENLRDVLARLNGDLKRINFGANITNKLGLTYTRK